ncbi:MAG: hypothetical protein N3F64_03670 [Nitrososphaeria archaeon]|nr:hypothetical protein [Nitrososphaeria archaeon]
MISQKYNRLNQKRFAKCFMLIILMLLILATSYSSIRTVKGGQANIVKVEKDIPPIFIGKSVLSLKINLETNEILLSGAEYELYTKISSLYSTYTGNIAVYLQLRIGKLDSGIWYMGVINRTITEIVLKTKYTVPLSINTADKFNITLTLIPVERGETIKTSFIVEQIKTFGYDTLFKKELIRIDVGYPDGVKNKVILQGSEIELYARIENLFPLQLENVKLFLYFNKTLVYTQNVGNISPQQIYSTKFSVNTFLLKEGAYYITSNITYMMENLYFSYGSLSSTTIDLVKPELNLRINKTSIINGDQIIAKIEIKPPKAISTLSTLAIEIVKDGNILKKETFYIIEPALEVPLRIFILTENPTEVITLRAYVTAEEKNFYSNEVKIRVISASAILNNLILKIDVEPETAFEGETFKAKVTTIPKFNLTLPITIEKYTDGIWITLKSIDVYEGEAYCDLELPTGTNILRAVIRIGLNVVESQRIQVKVIPKPNIIIEGAGKVLANTTTKFKINVLNEKGLDFKFNGRLLQYYGNTLILNKSMEVKPGENEFELKVGKQIGKNKIIFTIPSIKLAAEKEFEVISLNLNIILPKNIEENSEFQVKVVSEQKISLNATLIVKNQETGKYVQNKDIVIFNGEALTTLKNLPMGKYVMTIVYQNTTVSSTQFSVIKTIINVDLTISKTKVSPSEKMQIEIRLAPPPSAATIALIEISRDSASTPIKSIPIGTSGIVKDEITAPTEVGKYKIRVKVQDTVDEEEFEVVGQSILSGEGMETILVIGAIVGVSTILYLMGRRR